MTHANTNSRWQAAAAAATEGICLLPMLIFTLLGLQRLSQPPSVFFFLPGALQPFVAPATATLLYGIVYAPLRLWRMAFYRRQICVSSMPRQSVFVLFFHAVGWRWKLWWRRGLALAIAVAPSALIWGCGSAVFTRRSVGGVLPLVCLVLGAVAFAGGVLISCIWQCRYTLAPLFILEGNRAETAMALSARCMRRRVGKYVNFIGGELPTLMLCLLIVPTVWIIPRFRRRRLVLLSEWMQPAL